MFFKLFHFCSIFLIFLFFGALTCSNLFWLNQTANLNVFCIVRLLTEHPTTGTVHPGSTFRIAKFYRDLNNSEKVGIPGGLEECLSIEAWVLMFSDYHIFGVWLGNCGALLHHQRSHYGYQGRQGGIAAWTKLHFHIRCNCLVLQSSVVLPWDD